MELYPFTPLPLIPQNPLVLSDCLPAVDSLTYATYAIWKLLFELVLPVNDSFPQMGEIPVGNNKF